MHGFPTTLYTADQVRVLDRDAIDKQGIPGYTLMGHAGHAVFEQIITRWPEIRNLIIFCGAGNNGGDGYVIARLAHQQGINVRVYYLSEPDSLPDDSRKAHADCVAAGVQVEAYSGQSLDEADVIVDALLGTGLQREITGEWQKAIEAINHCDKPVVSVDIPSGIHADTGQAMNIAVKADCTVTFIGLKRGLFTGDAPDYVGKLVFNGLQVSVTDDSKPGDEICHLIDEEIKACLPRRKRIVHKGDNGHVLIIGGNRGMAGASQLAGMAALRSGAGLVSIATPVEQTSSGLQPEVMLHHVISADQLRPLLGKSTIVVIGPGLGQDDWAQTMMAVVMEYERPLVVDADGLNLLTREIDRKHNWVLTPHPGEAARLLNISVADIQANRFQAAVRLKETYGGVIVLKGAGTLIAGEGLSLCWQGNPGMATAGMGDILSGIIAALIAQGVPDEQAAQLGVWVHANAADKEAKRQGERGMVATDLLLPVRKLLND